MRYVFRNGLSGKSFESVLKVRCSTPLDHHDYHSHYEIYYCRQNVAQDIIINGQQLILEGPAIIFSTPFSIHGMSRHLAENNEFERIILYFDDTFLGGFAEGMLPEEFLYKYPNCIYTLTDSENCLMSVLFEQLMEADGHRAEVMSYFAAIINTLVRTVEPERRIMKGSASNYIIEVLRYIYEHISEELSTDGIAHSFHISRAKLDRDFRKFVGQSVHRTIIDSRIAYATDMLRNTDKSVREIAAHTGFESEYYFYAFYKKNTGRTPSAERKARRRSEQ